jgi:NAD(P)-dependent dehydrogenase (short-subunit alcohol dehydrogenase family)
MSAHLQAAAAGESTFTGLIKRQFTKPKPLPDVNLTSQIAIITGANAGLGFEASRHLLKLGLSRLIMGVRSRTKGDKAASLLRQEFPSATVDVWILDMTSYDSIQSFVKQVETLSRLDIVILNAGMGATTYETVPTTGHELTIQVNYLSTALLALLLLPILKSYSARIPASARNGHPPALSHVGSDIMYSHSIPDPITGPPILSRWDDPKQFSMTKIYGISKVLLLLFGWKLAELVDADEVLVNVTNPGMTGGTEFFAKSPFLVRKIIGLLQAALARTTESAATIYVDAVLGHGKESHGGFVSDWAIKP